MPASQPRAILKQYRYFFRLTALLLACLCLTGCDRSILSGGNHVEDLLRAPRTDERQSAVQTALNTYLGETLQLKYPRGGSEPDPVLFADLDGDGDEEAAVLYTAQNKGQNVHLSILEPAGENWNVAYEVMGLSTEVAEAALCEVFPGSIQLVVGYANSNLTDKYLEVYDYHDVTLISACRQPYEAYWLGEAGESGMRLAIAGALQQEGGSGAAALTLYEPSERALIPSQVAMLDERIEKCTALSATKSGTRHGFVVDGLTAEGAASQFLEVRGGMLTLCADSELGGAACYTRPRALAALTPRDLSGAGELFAAAGGESIATPRSAGRFYTVDWTNGMRDPAMRQSGIFDVQSGVFVRLPDAWLGAVRLTEQPDANWQLRRSEDNALLCTVRIEDDGDGVTLEFGEACRDPERGILLRGIMRVDER